jgi:hypothetical protein
MSNVRALTERSTLTPLQSAFMSFEPDLCDLVRAVELVMVAKEVSDETDDENEQVLGVALDDLRNRCRAIKQKWYDQHREVLRSR